MEVDLRVLELLSSKICHDLISPVSAINNGVELIEDIGESVTQEAMKLIGDSAVQSSRRLKLFRVAYGRAGSEANLPLRDIRPIIEQYFEGGKIKMLWDPSLELPEITDACGALKTLINMLIMSEEILAYGGEISLHRMGDGDTTGCRLEIVGKAAHLSPAFSAALDGTTPVEELTPRTIQSYVTGRFAAHFGLNVSSATPRDDRLDLMLTVRPNEYDKRPVL